MTIAHTWTIAQLDCYPEHDGETDVVVTAHWRLNGTDGEHTAGVYGTVGFTITPPLTPYADLTEEQVIGWVQDALGEEQVAAHEAAVEAQIAALVNPPVVSPALPWA